MKTLAVLLLSFPWCGVPCLRADAPEIEPMQPDLIVEMQVVALSRNIALPLVREMMDKRKIDGAQARLQDLLEKGTAKLLGWPTITTHSGQRAVIEATDEYRYAAVFVPGGRAVSVAEQAGVAGTENRAQALTIVRDPTVAGAKVNSTTKDFETGVLGVTLEAESFFAPDDQNFTLDIIAQHTWLKGMMEIAVERELTHEKVVADYPEFSSTRITTTLTVKSGRWMLLGVSPAPGGSGDLELFLLRAEVQKAP